FPKRFACRPHQAVCSMTDQLPATILASQEHWRKIKRRPRHGDELAFSNRLLHSLDSLLSSFGHRVFGIPSRLCEGPNPLSDNIEHEGASVFQFAHASVQCVGKFAGFGHCCSLDVESFGCLLETDVGVAEITSHILLCFAHAWCVRHHPHPRVVKASIV